MKLPSFRLNDSSFQSFCSATGRRRLRATSILFILASGAPSPVAAQVDLQAVTRIRQEGFRNSQVMRIASELTDRIGPRLTGSPSMKAANDWTRQQFADWGLANARIEPWSPFGRGWSYEHVSVRMTQPMTVPLLAVPKAWTHGTNGVVKGEPIRADLATEEEFAKFKGKLAGKIVLRGAPREIKPPETSGVTRHDEKSLGEIFNYQIPADRSGRSPAEFQSRTQLRRKLNQFLIDEKAAVLVEPGSGGESGIFDVQSGGGFKKDEPVGVPSVVLNPEHYNRIVRLLDAKQRVELEVDVRTTLHEADVQYNTIAEIPGTDKKNEIVMLGAHLDSWHSGTGATDNAAGSAAMMEAIRILKATGLKPRRTIRIALWSGEEQGLLGSKAYVAAHFASYPPPKESERDIPSSMRRDRGPLTRKPDYQRLSAYFNMDNGTGRIRGIYTQENAAAVPIFRSWLEPLHDLGATTVTMRTTPSTDHMSFDEVGLPGFQFIQDDVEYTSTTHHSTADVYERLQREDLMQAAVVIASFVYNAAMRDEMMPRKPLAESPRSAARPIGGGTR